jgi:Fe-S cluster assembly protein SufD
MSGTGTIPDCWQAALDAALSGREAAEREARREAFARFRERGFPSTRDEDWRHVDLAPIARTAFETPPVADAGAVRALSASPRPGLAEEAARLVFVNGRFVDALSRLDGLPEGLEAGPLRSAAQEVAVAAGEAPAHPFADLNAALWRDGAFVRLAPGAHVDRPVHVVHLVHGTVAASVAHPRVVVLAGARSRGALVQTFGGRPTGPWLTNAVTLLRVGEGARMDHLEVQEEDPTAWHVHVLDARIERDAQLATHVLSLGAAVSRREAAVVLAGPGAACRLDGLMVADGTRHVDHRTNVDHAVPHGTSRQLFKAILEDHATTAFAGRVLVRQDAQQTDAKQSNHNLLLSRDAVADSKPQLEIFADDVKCAHGATVGQLDEDSVFYLRSRGIAESDARAMLVRAFAAEIPSCVEHEILRAHAQARLRQRLPGDA